MYTPSKQWHRIKSIRPKIQVFIHFAPCWILFLPEQLGIGTSVQLGVRDNDWKRPSIEIKRRLSSTHKHKHSHTVIHTLKIYFYINYSPEQQQKDECTVLCVKYSFRIIFAYYWFYTVPEFYRIHTFDAMILISTIRLWLEYMWVELNAYYCS